MHYVKIVFIMIIVINYQRQAQRKVVITLGVLGKLRPEIDSGTTNPN